MKFGKGVGGAPIVSVIDLKGAITPGKGVSHDRLKHSIDKAFSKGVSAVALDINCPGGSPTQSELIANRIRRRSEETGIPVFAFSQDIAASGGYWLACAADEIYAPKTATIGSIGVITQSLAYADLAKKLGVEQRTYTAGANKSKMSPFKPVDPKDEKWINAHLSEMHEMFKDWVKERRNGKFAAGLDLDKDVFNADVWHAKKCVDMGLIDGIGEMEPVMAKKLGVPESQIKFVPVVKGPGLAALFNARAQAMFGKSQTPQLDSEAFGRGFAEGMIKAAKEQDNDLPEFKYKP